MLIDRCGHRRPVIPRGRWSHTPYTGWASETGRTLTPCRQPAQRVTCFALRMFATALTNRPRPSGPAWTAATSAAAVALVSDATWASAAVYRTMSAPALIAATTALGTE